ncbi:crustacyanin subunit A [Penaeus vannamei]|uniref:Crustacyanin subunit A n=1 Tax=Penaeus vannamei TaxID=6689 RepID=A0A3R7MK14_PENVA|nr:crustacyanin-A2 subunit-like [Penaeus vannamei]ROT83810.1 crustacyanin subunit A [Penaeus vannamei]
MTTEVNDHSSAHRKRDIRAPGILVWSTTEKSCLPHSSLLPRGLVSADGIPDFVVPGRCAKVANQDKFDLRRYSGRWYQTQIIDNAYQPYTRCIHSNYDYSDSDYGFKVTTAGFSPNNEYLRLQGKIYPTKDFPAAHMLIDFPTVFAAPYEVIETDYDSYSCVYSCIDWNGYKSEFVFRLPVQRTTSAPPSSRKNGVDFSSFNEVAHTAECVYRA